jgi:hypothetical protein
MAPRRADADGRAPRRDCADVLVEQPTRFAFRRMVVSRGWELFQHTVPASLLDHLAMRYLHARFGSTGNVVAVLWQAV